MASPNRSEPQNQKKSPRGGEQACEFEEDAPEGSWRDFTLQEALWTLAKWSAPIPSASGSLGASSGLQPLPQTPAPSPMTLRLGAPRAHSPYLRHLDLPDSEVDLLGMGACLGILETVRLPEATAAVHRIHAVPVRTCRGGSNTHRHQPDQLITSNFQTRIPGRPPPHAPSLKLGRRLSTRSLEGSEQPQ